MRITFSIIIILLVSFCWGGVNYGAAFFTINTSAAEVAYGNDAGTANIWNLSPTDCVFNPAKLGYLGEGVSIGFASSDFFGDADDSDVVTSSSYIGAYWHGLGVLLPMVDANGYWGKSIDYGEEEYTDENGNFIENRETYGKVSTFGVGVNVLEFLGYARQSKEMQTLSERVDLSVGYQYTYLQEQYFRGTYVNYAAQWVKGHGHTDALGFLARWTPSADGTLVGDMMELDLTCGFSLLNLTGGEIEYSGDDDTDDAPSGHYFAIASQARIPERSGMLPNFCRNMVTATMMYDTYGYEGSSTYSFGLGCTMLDIFSVRYGHYDDNDGRIVGDNWGWGINLNYRDLVQAKFDWARETAGELTDHNDVWDLSARVNVLELMRK